MSFLERLRQAARGVREYPKISNDLVETQYKLKEVQETLDRSNQEREELNATLQERTHRLDFAEQKAAATLSALVTFCPKLSSLKDMKRFHAAVSTGLDPKGYTLYHAAKRMTGIDLRSLFPYENNRGIFTAMDGHQLLRWLIAVRFNAVEWETAKGSRYEAATLWEVNTSTPEYRAFERKLYRTALDRMGFGDLLVPENPAKTQQKNEVIEMKRVEPKEELRPQRGGDAR